MKLQLSRTFVAISAQGILNLFLASWMYLEYAHNRFLQEYLAQFWAANSTIVSLGVVATGVIGVASFYERYRRRESEGHNGTPIPGHGMTVGLTALDVCPSCNTPLISLSESRFQCRNCRRYFKK